MPWINQDGDISELRPNRVRLPNSETRTAEEVTDEVLAEAGWYWEEPVVIVAPPVVDPEPITLQQELVLEPPIAEITANSSAVFTEFEVPLNITINNT